MESRPPSASATETVQLVLPGNANPHGTVFGGRVVMWIDLVASMAAQRHSRQVVVTAAIDAMAFLEPIDVGDYAVLNARVNRTWETSMEVEVHVEAEHPLTGRRRHSASAFLTFVALDEEGRPTPVRPIEPETDDEWACWRDAEARRQARLAAR